MKNITQDQLITTGKVKYFARWSDGRNTWTANIVDVRKNSNYSAKRVSVNYENPFTIEWDSESTFDNIVSGRATLSVLSEKDRMFIDLYTESSRDIFLIVYRNGKLFWLGGLESEQYEEEYTYRENYFVNLTFCDFANLDRIKFNHSGIVSVQDLITYCCTAAYRPLELDAEFWKKKLPQPKVVFSCSTRLANAINLVQDVSTLDFLDYEQHNIPPNPTPITPADDEDIIDVNPDDFDPSNPTNWTETLHDTVELHRGKGKKGTENISLLPSFYNGDFSPSVSVNNQNIQIHNGANGLAKVFVRLDNFYSDEGEAMTFYEVLAEILKVFCLRIQLKNGIIYVYDINSVFRFGKRKLHPVKTDQVLSAYKVYKDAEIRISLNESEEIHQEDPFKEKIKNPTYSEKVPSNSFYKKFDSYSLRLKKPTGEDPYPFISHDGSYLFETEKITSGQNERGIAVWSCPGNYKGEQLIKARHTKENLPNIPQQHERVNRLLQKRINTLSDNDACFHVKGIKLPVATKEFRDNYSFAFDLKVKLSTDIDFFNHLSEDQCHDKVERNRLKLLNKQIEKFKYLGLLVKIYATDSKGTRLAVLNNIRPSDKWNESIANHWFFGVSDIPTWKPISEDKKSYLYIQYGTEKNAFRANTWTSPNAESFVLDSSFLFSSEHLTNLGWEVSDVWKKGAIIPIPERGEKLEILVMNIPLVDPDVNTVFGYGKFEMLNLKHPCFHIFSSFLLKDMQLSICTKNGTELKSEDIIYSATIDENAKEKFTDTLLFSSNADIAPASKCLLLDEDEKRISQKLSRNRIHGTIEQLYFNTLFTAFGERKIKLTGTWKAFPGLTLYKEMNKTFLPISESLNTGTSESEMTLIEIEKDKYKALEEEN